MGLTIVHIFIVIFSLFVYTAKHTSERHARLYESDLLIFKCITGKQKFFKHDCKYGRRFYHDTSKHDQYILSTGVCLSATNKDGSDRARSS